MDTSQITIDNGHIDKSTNGYQYYQWTEHITIMIDP